MRKDWTDVNLTMCAIANTLIVFALLQLTLCMDIPAPVQTNLSSQNFIHSLSWEKGPGSPDGVRYTVTVRTYSTPKVEEVVKECENVTSPLRCNLTEALSDLEEIYYVSVFAALGSRFSPPSHCPGFNPIENTTLEVPLLAIAECNRTLCVSLRAPAERLHQLYDSHKFNYRLMVSSEDGPKFRVDTNGLKNVTLKDLAPGRRYCVNVTIVDRRTTPRPPVCASISKPANVPDAVISAILCLLMLLALMSSPKLISRWYCLKPELPAALRSVKNRDEFLLTKPVELINVLFEERDSVRRMKRNDDETDVEGETEERGAYERVVAHYLDPQGSSLLIYPVLSRSNSSPDAHISLTSSTDAQSHSVIVFEDGHGQTTEPTASPQGTNPLQSLSIVLPTHVEDEESETDVNLFSVTLGDVSAEPLKAEPDKACSIEDELEMFPQSLLLTDSQSQNFTGNHIVEEEEEDDDECSGYLSRN